MVTIKRKQIKPLKGSPIAKFRREKKIKTELRDVEILKEREEERKRKREREKKSKVRRVLGVTKRAVSSIARKGLRRTVLEQDIVRDAKLTSEERNLLLRRLRKRFAGRRPQQFKQSFVPQGPRPDPFFSQVFVSGNAMANVVEREISNPQGFASDGDNTALNMARPGFGNVFEQLDREAVVNANFQDVGAVLNIDAEAFNFANIVQ